MTPDAPPPPGSIGLIEGFFGRQWSWQDRHLALEFLANTGFSFYFYAPKGDVHLRSRWQTPWPADTLEHLLALRHRCRELGLTFGLGLSPLELYREDPQQARRALNTKLDELQRLEPDTLCLLFDDMRGDLPDLAERQVDLAHCAAGHTCASQLILCPTYYSDDPVLEKVFGQRPVNYWEELGRKLDPHIGIFWTGPKVCSSHYPLEHLNDVGALLQRKPFLWDNYPVNDSSVKSRHLLLRGVDQGHAALSGHLAGHAVNPMNQAWLSRIPLLSAMAAYRLGDSYDPAEVFSEACRKVCSAGLAQALIEDVGLFQDQGLDVLSAGQREALAVRYQAWEDEACAREVIGWLRGEYAFDPACLTE